MAEFTGFTHGMGIGGWLTNYKRLYVLPDEWRRPITIGDWEHFRTYITHSDVEYIASIGMDHIRLAFDQTVLEDYERPGVFRDEIWELLDNFVGWCEDAGINVVLNMHKAIGNDCGIAEPVSLLDDDGLQSRFINVWTEIENHYSCKPKIAFELLNEVRNVPPELWNNIASRTLDAIRRLNSTRKVIIGSTCWNSPATMPKLRLYDDENVIYTWHMYAPNEFTHQRGVLQAPMVYYNRIMPYPALTEEEVEKFRDFQRFVAKNDHAYDGVQTIDRQYLRKVMQPALDLTRQHPEKVFWLGEFGTIRHISIKERENYMRDVIAICREYGVAYCVWNYLSTPNDGNNFSLVDEFNRKVLSPEMLRIITAGIN